MKALKRIAIVLLGLFVAIQFIRPPKNISTKEPNHIATKYAVPPEVQAILQTSCNDCHTNNTRYPWYSEIQPIGWVLNGHIQDGKRSLNLSEFTTYRLRRQYHKLEEIGDMVYDDRMPLPDYLILHSEARLSQEQKKKLIDWAEELRESMKAEYPADSLMAGK
jgi:hypothetical protein